MSPDLVALLYLVAGVLFILALRGLSSPETSRQGNLFGMVGMAIAIVTTLASHPPDSVGAWSLVVLGSCSDGAGRGSKRGSIVAYLALGWMIVLGMRPMLASVDPLTALLIGVGGVLYSVGVGFHLWRTLPFHNAIWHSFVLVAASCHYAAILHGVVLARA